MVAAVGFVRLTAKVSLSSIAVSPLTGTLICFAVWPGANVSVPVVAV
jgi:hypothetical protein